MGRLPARPSYAPAKPRIPGSSQLGPGIPVEISIVAVRVPLPRTAHRASQRFAKLLRPSQSGRDRKRTPLAAAALTRAGKQATIGLGRQRARKLHWRAKATCALPILGGGRGGVVASTKSVSHCQLTVPWAAAWRLRAAHQRGRLSDAGTWPRRFDQLRACPADSSALPGSRATSKASATSSLKARDILFLGRGRDCFPLAMARPLNSRKIKLYPRRVARVRRAERTARLRWL